MPGDLKRKSSPGAELILYMQLSCTSAPTFLPQHINIMFEEPFMPCARLGHSGFLQDLTGSGSGTSGTSSHAYFYCIL